MPATEEEEEEEEEELTWQKQAQAAPGDTMLGPTTLAEAMGKKTAGELIVEIEKAQEATKRSQLHFGRGDPLQLRCLTVSGEGTL